MLKRRKGHDLKALVEKYQRYSVVSEIEKNLSRAVPSLYPTSSLFLADLFQAENYDLDQYQTLEDSLKKDGFLTPLVIVALPDGKGYEILNGVKRYLLGKKNGLTAMPAVLASLSQERRNSYIIENILAEENCPLVKTYCFERLQEKYGYSEQRLSEESGLSRSQVKNLKRLGGLPDFLKAGIRSFTLSYAEARTLLNLPEKDQKLLYGKIKSNEISVRELESYKRISFGKNRTVKVRQDGKNIVLTFADEEEAKKRYPSIVSSFRD
jgi:ParB family transcriptional regulator, chromosome partitioning protein